MVNLRPSVAILIPASIGERSPNGTSLVASSHSKTALHISAARMLMSEGFLDMASGAIHVGWYIF